MDKRHPSRKQTRPFLGTLVSLFLSLALVGSALSAIDLPQGEALRIGKRIWQNECGGTISGLTSWNTGEDFASLGIGHFIWYPEGKRGPFDESFPKFMNFAIAERRSLPAWIQHSGVGAAGVIPCPWNSRAEFLRDQNSPRTKELRQFLAETVGLQARFLVQRLQDALPKMLKETAPANRPKIEVRFQRLARSSRGCYALVDYVNFKGEGVLPTERYQGEGWGLLQVLEQMHDSNADAVTEFSRSAATVLKHRVHNAPSGRNESRWLPGWLNRVNSYSRD